MRVESPRLGDEFHVIPFVLTLAPRGEDDGLDGLGALFILRRSAYIEREDVAHCLPAASVTPALQGFAVRYLVHDHHHDLILTPLLDLVQGEVGTTCIDAVRVKHQDDAVDLPRWEIRHSLSILSHSWVIRLTTSLRL